MENENKNTPSVTNTEIINQTKYLSLSNREIRGTRRKTRLYNNSLREIIVTQKLAFQYEQNIVRHRHKIEGLESIHQKFIEKDKEEIEREKLQTSLLKEQLIKISDENDFNRDKNNIYLEMVRKEDIDTNVSIIMTAPVNSKTMLDFIKEHYRHEEEKLKNYQKDDHFSDYQKEKTSLNNEHKIRIDEMKNASNYYEETEKEKRKALDKINFLDISDEEKERMLNQAEAYYENLKIDGV